MSVNEDHFMQLSEKEKWTLYNKATVDSASFAKLTEKLDKALSALSKCESKIVALESQLKVSQTVNKNLVEDNLLQKKRLNKIEQYSRRENVVISGIPADSTDVEKKLMCILKNVGVSVQPSEISACHAIKKKGDYILRFVNRKIVNQIFQKRNQIEAYNSSEIWGQSAKHRVYPNLSPTYSKLRYLAKKLKGMGAVNHFGSNSNGVWIQKEVESAKTPIDCDEDVAALLPEGIILSDILS